MPFKKGDLLQQKVEIVQGPVLDVRYDADQGTFDYLVGFVGPDGEESSRWFDESQVEAAPSNPEGV
jgi:hypothetical protein